MSFLSPLFSIRVGGGREGWRERGRDEGKARERGRGGWQEIERGGGWEEKEGRKEEIKKRKGGKHGEKRGSGVGREARPSPWSSINLPARPR